MSQWLDYVRYGNGHDGSPAVSGTINSYATMIGTSGSTTVTTSLSISIGDVVLCHQSQWTGAGNWQLVTVKTTGSGNFTANETLAYTYGTGAQAVLVPQYTGGTISGAITGSAWNGSVGGIIALMSNGDLVNAGSITPPAGFRGGSQRQDYAYTGEGHTGGSYLMSANYQHQGNGGSGGHHDSPPDNIGVSGSGGGNGTAGGSAYYSTGGDAVGNAGLTSMLFGGGGGGGSKGNGDGGTAGNGAAGSGIVLIFAKNFTTSSGTIPATGSNGQQLNNTDGGSGAGGSVLIKCQNAILGTNKITASGGSGGNGGAGGVGRIHIDYSDSISGTTTPTLDSTQVASLKSQVYGGMI